MKRDKSASFFSALNNSINCRKYAQICRISDRKRGIFPPHPQEFMANLGSARSCKSRNSVGRDDRLSSPVDPCWLIIRLSVRLSVGSARRVSRKRMPDRWIADFDRCQDGVWL